MDRPEISQEEMNKPIPKKEFKELPLLPEREWLEATIVKTDYRVSMFKGQIQYVSDAETKEPILDKDGNKIQRKEFNITFELRDYKLPQCKDGKPASPRKAWLKIGAAFGDRAHLPVFLLNIGVSLEEPTPKKIIDALWNKRVKLQFANRCSEKDKKIYQNIVWDAVKLSDRQPTPESKSSQPEVINADEVAWDE